MPSSMTHASPRSGSRPTGFGWGLGFVLVVLGGCEFKLGDLEQEGTTGTGGTSSSSTTGVEEDTDAMPHSATTGELPSPPGECCASHPEPGCADDDIASCVCEFDRFCCTNAWDDRCVQRIAELGCGVCEGNEGTCCEPSRTPGCGDADVQRCVCEVDAFCCTERWDEVCVQRVDEFGCGTCPANDPAGDTNPAASCCDAGGPGCPDPDVENCVCQADPYCCSTGWDDVCIQKVEALGCGDCHSGPYGIDDCCSPNDTACEDPAIARCVCTALPECCQGPWTDACVEAITTLGCSECPLQPELGTSTGYDDEATSSSSG